MDKSSPVVWLGVWLQLDSLAGKGSVRVCKGFPVSAHRNMQIIWSGDSKWLVGVNVSEFGCPPWTQELNIRTDIIWQSRFSINKPSVEYSAEPSWQTDSDKISVWLIKILLVRSDTSGFTVSSRLLAELLHRKCPRLCTNWVKMQRNETLREKQVINQVSRLPGRQHRRFYEEQRSLQWKPCIGGAFSWEITQPANHT